ncbi:MAG: hypothetical protein EXS05_00410 [Planctomycetaceae bacterium]|nr:hypothetical protein [Planctomycetaceae bacterium]
MNDSVATSGFCIGMLDPCRQRALHFGVPSAWEEELSAPETAFFGFGLRVHPIPSAQIAASAFVIGATTMALAIGCLRLEADDQNSRPVNLPQGLGLSASFPHVTSQADDADELAVAIGWNRSSYRAMKLAAEYGSATNADY